MIWYSENTIKKIDVLQVKEVKIKEVDISNLSKGIYFVKIISFHMGRSKSTTRKIIKN